MKHNKNTCVWVPTMVYNRLNLTLCPTETVQGDSSAQPLQKLHSSVYANEMGRKRTLNCHFNHDC